MKKWEVIIASIETVDTLDSLGILYYVPLFPEVLKVVFVATDMTERELVKIPGVVAVSEANLEDVHI